MKLELGAEPRKVAILLVLLAAGGYLFYDNVLNAPPPGGGSAPARPKTNPLTQALAPAEGLATPPVKATPPRVPGARGRAGEFRPSLKAAGEAVTRDLSKFDPTLRLDLLEKAASVTVGRVDRSLFEFASAPPKPAADQPKLPEPKITVARKFIGPPEAPPPPAPPPKPKPPAINLKFYGSSLPVAGGVKRVFCLEGDEIFTPAEGDVLKKRYKIVRITPTSVVVEDLDYKHQQTLPIEQIPSSG